MKKIFSLLILAISCFVLPQLAFAGAWTLPEGSMWIEQTVKYSFASDDFNTKHTMKSKSNGAESWTWGSITKAEYGVTNWLTLLTGVEYKESHYKEYERPSSWGKYDVSNHAFTTLDLGTKVRLLADPVVLSAQIKTSFYLGGKKYTDPLPGGMFGHNSEDKPAISDGNDAVEFKMLVGKRFDTFIPCYFGAETGYRLKNRHIPNDIPVFVEGGFWPLSWLLIKAELDSYFCHEGTGDLEKEYAIARIGPVFRLFGGGALGEYGVTREGSFLDLALQYGLTFWGKSTSADQEIVVKLSGQF